LIDLYKLLSLFQILFPKETVYGYRVLLRPAQFGYRLLTPYEVTALMITPYGLGSH
jgi:hypothetical protein